MEAWITEHWFDLIQSAGIIGALVFSLEGRRGDKKARKLKNLTDLIENHRTIWRDYAMDPELGRIKAEDVDLEKEPITSKEAIFVRSIITHLLGAYEATRLNEIVGLEKLGEDAGQFLSLPIPNAVWQEVKGVQESTFAQFVESNQRVKAIFVNPELAIAPATCSDAAEIQNVIREASRSVYSDCGFPLEYIQEKFKNVMSRESVSRCEKNLHGLRDTETFLVAKHGGQVVGICHVEKARSKNVLHSIYVLPRYQKRGLGRTLWNTAREYLNCEKETSVLVFRCNRGAIAFYRKLGFISGHVIIDSETKVNSDIPLLELVRAEAHSSFRQGAGFTNPRNR